MMENVKMVWRAARIIAQGNMDINGTRKMIAVLNWVRRNFHSSFSYLMGCDNMQFVCSFNIDYMDF